MIVERFKQGNNMDLCGVSYQTQGKFLQRCKKSPTEEVFFMGNSPCLSLEIVDLLNHVQWHTREVRLEKKIKAVYLRLADSIVLARHWLNPRDIHLQ